MLPVVHGLEAEYWGKIDFVYLDIGFVPRDVKERYGFIAQPLFVLVEADGTEVERWFGYTSESAFREAFDAYLASIEEEQQ